MTMDFKDESDVKDYIERLGIEYRFGCYSEKKPEGECERFTFVTGIPQFHYFSLSSPRGLSGEHQEGFRESLQGVQVKL